MRVIQVDQLLGTAIAPVVGVEPLGSILQYGDPNGIRTRVITVKG